MNDSKINVLLMGYSHKIGLTYHLACLAESLKRNGLNVTVISSDREQQKGLKEGLKQAGIKYYEVKSIEKSLYILWKAIPTIRRIINSEDIDVIHLQGFLHLIPAYVATKLTSKKVGLVLTVNAYGKGYHAGRTKILHKILIKAMNLCVDIVMPVSDMLKQELISDGLMPDKVTVVHWGVDLKKYESASDGTDIPEYRVIQQKTTGNIVACSAKLCERKGHKYYIEAASKVIKVFPETTFLITGEGIIREELEILAYSLGISKNVIFTGWIEKHEVLAKLLSHVDICVVPSLAETFSIALIEGLAAGKPVVTTPIGVAPEIVTEENKIGYIVPKADPDSLAEAIIKLLEDPIQMREMGEKGRKLFECKFDLNVIAGKLKEVYELAYRKKLNLEEIS